PGTSRAYRRGDAGAPPGPLRSSDICLPAPTKRTSDRRCTRTSRSPPRRSPAADRDHSIHIRGEAAAWLPPRLQRLSVDEIGGHDVLDRDADRFVQGDLVRRLTAGLGACDDLADLGENLARSDDVSRFACRRLALLDIELGFSQSLVVELSPGRSRGPNGVDVRARREPRARQHGRL